MAAFLVTLGKTAYVVNASFLAFAVVCLVATVAMTVRLWRNFKRQPQIPAVAGFRSSSGIKPLRSRFRYQAGVENEQDIERCSCKRHAHEGRGSIWVPAFSLLRFQRL
jgi:hypothetical protein